jgi:hypothetical protein
MYLVPPSTAYRPRPGFSGLRGMRARRGSALAGLGSYRMAVRRMRGIGQDSVDTTFDPTASLPLDTTTIDTTSIYGSVPSMPAPDYILNGSPGSIAPPAIPGTGAPNVLTSSLTIPGTSYPMTPAAPASNPLAAISQLFSAGASVLKATSPTGVAAPAGYGYNASGQLVPLSQSPSIGLPVILLGAGILIFALSAGAGARR